MSDKRILGFDGLRAIAFTLVFFSHAMNTENAGPFGGLGVSLFFVLSGLLITRILAAAREEIEREKATVLSGLSRFYLRRSARIFPPYYLLLGIIGLISLATPIEHFWRTEKLAYAFYATNVLIAWRGEWLGNFGHFWTLAVEEQFYLLLAPLVLFLPRKHTLALCAAVIAAGIAVQSYLQLSGASSIAIGINSFSNFILLGYGGAIGLIAHRRLPSQLTSGAAQLAALAVFVSVPLFVTASPDAWQRYGGLPALIVGLLLIQIMQGQRSWFVLGVLNTLPLRALGRVSYGAYLVHNFIHVPTILSALEPHGIDVTLSWSAVTAIEYAITIAIAAVSWHFLERPIVDWAARATAARAPASIGPHPVKSLRSDA